MFSKLNLSPFFTGHQEGGCEPRTGGLGSGPRAPPAAAPPVRPRPTSFACPRGGPSAGALLGPPLPPHRRSPGPCALGRSPSLPTSPGTSGGHCPWQWAFPRGPQGGPASHYARGCAHACVWRVVGQNSGLRRRTGPAAHRLQWDCPVMEAEVPPSARRGCTRGGGAGPASGTCA